MIAYVVNLLVSDGAVVLEDVVVLSTSGSDELLDSGLSLGELHGITQLLEYGLETYQDLAQLVIRDIMELSSVVLRDDELYDDKSAYFSWRQQGYEDPRMGTHGVAFAQRTNVEESIGLVALKELEGRDLA